ncbi:MAG: discoidin domain-containing protein [Coriobacteriia bacterium]|nr:discoidin domain-containing protein [Coriobacteriia bacterium]
MVRLLALRVVLLTAAFVASVAVPPAALAEPFAVVGDGLADSVYRAYTPSGWRSVLYPVDWAPGYADSAGRAMADFSYAGYKRGEQPIPVVTGPAFVDVSQPPYSLESSVTTDVTSVIQAALDDVGARGGGVVYLPPATYRVSAADAAKAALTIRYSNVVLRGAGRSRTFLVNTTSAMRGKSVILASPALSGGWHVPPPGAPANLIGDSRAGSNEVMVDTPHDFAPGNLIVIRTEATAQWVAERGNLRNWNAATMDATTYLRRVTGLKVGGVLVLDAPLRTDVLVRDRGTMANVYRARPHLSGVGVEDLSIGMLEYPQWGNIAYDVHESAVVKYQNVEDSWVQRVSTFKPAGNRRSHLLSEGVWIDNSRQVTVRECIVAYPQYRGAGNGNGFVIRGSDNLLEECGAVEARHAYTFGMWQATGNVIRDSVSARPLLKTDFHMWFSAVNLLEKLLMDGHGVDATFRNDGTNAIHGHTTSQSVLWNLIGVRKPTSWSAGPLVDTVQYDWGAAVGTSGAYSSISNDPSLDALNADWTLDLVEGQGRGGTLVPQSLYRDQLRRRTGASGGDTYLVRGRVVAPRHGSALIKGGSVGTAGVPGEVRLGAGRGLRMTFSLVSTDRVSRARLVLTGRVGKRAARLVVRGVDPSSGKTVTLASAVRTRAMAPVWVIDVTPYLRERRVAGASSVVIDLTEELGAGSEIAVRTESSAPATRPRLEIETAPGPVLTGAAVVESGSPAAVAAVDGRLSTSFAASPGRGLVIDLGAPRTVSGVGAAFGGGTTRFSFAEVEVSSDGTSWIPVSTLIGGGTTDSIEIFEWAQPVKTRYLRFSGLGTTSLTTPSTTYLREVEVYGR